MTWNCNGRAFFPLALPPTGRELPVGRVPKWLRSRLAPAPRRGRTLLASYAALLDTLPRVVGASPAIVLATAATTGIVATGRGVAAGVSPQRAASAAS